jgi:hypothetical protein
MAGQVRTIDFLPEIFQTTVNRQFLNATLDQLVQEPQFKKTQGYVGRRVGPGVNATDKYVIEPTASRTNYQLEPGVVEIDPENSNKILDTITYPGITDALKLQGAITDNADRLYTSEYYAFDPFVDFDKFTNFAQYYWLPSGPLAVDVSATTIPLTDDITVTRANGVYTFSGYAGNNPSITLVRGGNYTFNVAQNAKETVNYRVTNSGISAYLIDYQPNPTLTLVRGNTYEFDLSLDGIYPFYIKTIASLGNVNTYNVGVTNNGATAGTITFIVPQDAPDTLYYSSSTEFNMRGTISVIDGTPGTGPGFWIQTDPGVNGTLPYAPNISSRDVMGVYNNGEDLGTITFDVPDKNAQSFYYGLTSIGTVDLVSSTLEFDQVNDQYVSSFFTQYPTGIDGITNLNGRTIIFLPNGGWYYNGTFDDPSQPFDTASFSFAEEITDPAVRKSVWQIQYVEDPQGELYIQLNSVTPVNEFEKFLITYGTEYSNTSWYKDAEGQFAEIPLLTAIKDILWYQDGTDPDIFGQIRLIDENQNTTLFVESNANPVTLYGAQINGNQLIVTGSSGVIVPGMRLSGGSVTAETYILAGSGNNWTLSHSATGNPTTAEIVEIIGAKNYTSPNGVVFTNGLKVTFRGSVYPTSYANNTYYVEGVGTAIKLLPISNFITPETYTQSGTVPYDSTPFDVGNFDATLNAPIIPDYLTINRASTDLNAWTRSNRWFHVDVINYSAELNNITPTVDNLQRARRPILEYRAGTRLFDFGTDAIAPVDIIDFSATDALSNINGSTGYSIDGYTFIDGTTVIFAADTDSSVRNQVYQVQFITPDTVPPLIAEPIINLTPVYSTPVQYDQTVVILSGQTQQGLSYWFDGINWIAAQQKTKTNQPPLFNVYDVDGISFSDRVKYPSTTFTGTKLFSYATPSTATETEIYSSLNDPVLGFQLVYLSLSNVGDIVFDNNLYKDTFVYASNSVGTTVPISNGFVREYSDRTTYKREIGWQTATTKSRSRQQFQFTYDARPLLLDVKVADSIIVPAIQLFVNATFQESNTYTVTTTDNTTKITLLTDHAIGSIIEVDVLSDQISPTAFYQVPTNLENNPLNANSEQFTLGTIRNHYGTICQNLIKLSGPINGANNTRDLGNIVPYGQQILQQSSPLTMAGYFMRSKQYDIFAALDYNSREYIKFKSKLLDTAVNKDFGEMTIPEILDSIIADITLGRTNLNPFYWSDMLPTGSVLQTTNTTVTAITTPVFNTIQTYDFTKSNYLGLLIYIYPAADPTTPILLERGYNYVVSTDSPRLTITVPLNIGDVVSIAEYNNTAGNFVPNTPTKLGLYPKFKPEIFLDTNYVNPTYVIQGHDGSITVAFQDFRDEILLEFEKRIYNNLKTDDNPIPLTIDEVMPGFFRTTDYTQAEITNILGESFLSWVGWNKLDYKAQDYVASNPFTYNYSEAGSKLIASTDQISNVGEQSLLGAWRGIYRYFYDTESPNYTPWEMLGLSEEPSWWADRYGPAPYTSDNLVLWDDLAAGYVADPLVPYIRPNYKRPNLQSVIPVGTEGQLLNPLESVVGAYNPTAFRKSWQVGDGGPVEYTWWTSSSYPYAVMRLLALTRPAEFFALFADRDDYRYNADLGQYLYNGRYRLDANGIPVYGNGISKASYIDWIVDYNQQLGLNSTDTLTTALANLDVRLCYRMAAFSDPQYLEIYTERSSPNSNNSSLLIPPESYNLVLYKNQPFADITYSALIVERVVDGYAIFGYSTVAPYFQILASASNGALQTINAGGTVVRVPAQYTNNIVQIPYGYTFTNTTMVVDFILSYGKYLESQGLIFDDRQNGYTLDWKQMAAEFLYFSQQGWSDGTMINLNPVATTLKAYKTGAVVDSIISLTPENMLLDQNRGVLESRNLVIDREGNYFTITSTNNQTISFLQLRWTNYEHMVVLDNRSIFNDLLYDTITAARQNRIRITAATTTEWTGEVNAPGFILNQNNVKQWQPYIKYTKGEIVKYKNQYWQAANIIQPTDKFDFNDWYKSNYDRVQQGLLPNIANKADQLANSYNINTANIERDNDLLSYGLIGFRPRQYMSDLNLDDVTQVNLYSQFLGTKGTVLAAELFTRADLGKETGAYDIYENWAVLASTYGANANRSFYELQLNEADLQANPATIQVIQPEQTSLADQTILLNNVWRSSYKLTSTDILPTTYDTNQESALPTAGYVNFDDVDITVFNINDPTSIEANINTVGIGTTIWVAKVNSYDWNIYRCSEDPATMFQLQDNLNGTSIAYFTGIHNLSVGDLVIIRYFNQGVNGVYRVLAVPSITSITIAFSFANVGQTTLTGTGLVFFLETMRVTQASDIVNLNYVKELLPGAKVWVDNNGSGHWEVVEKQDVFVVFEELLPLERVSNSLYGTSVTQSENHFSAFVGSPNADTGTVQTYRRDEFTAYIPNILLKLNATDVAGFGNWVDIGNSTWGAAAATASNSNNGYVSILYLVPGSNDIIQTQLLVPPEVSATPFEFGHELSFSTNERWLYISAPGVKKVYAYGRVDVETQTVTYLSDGITKEFTYSNNIQIDSSNPNQLRVFVNNLEAIYGVDYLINTTNVIFTTAPVQEQKVVISRRQAVQLDQTVYYSLFQNATSGSGQLAQFTVTNTRGTYYVSLVNPGNSYNNGDTITIDYTQICPAGSVANNLTITVTDVSTGGLINTFTTSGSGIDNTSVFALNQSLYTATNIDSFTVIVDGIYQRPTIDYTFDSGTTEITFVTNPDPGTAISVISSTYWQYTGNFSIAGLDAGARFGDSVNTALDGRQIVIGAPRDIAGSAAHAGSAYVIDRGVVAYQITDTSQLSYTIPGDYAYPIMVSLNGQFLTNTDQFINGQFTVTGGDVVLSSSVSLTIGDTLEIETNLFQFLEKITADDPVDEAAYGYSVKLCHTDCSIYIGAPFDTVVLPQDGAVYRSVNQSRVYGVITSTIANPTLTPGDTIRINNFQVAVPAEGTVESLVTEINLSAIPNAIATTTPDLTFIGDGFTKVFDVGSIYSAASSYTTVVYVGATLQTSGVDYTYNNTTKQINFVTAPASLSVITVVSGRITISVKNIQAAPVSNKLTVLPGLSASDSTIGAAFYDLGFITYPQVQEITSPRPTDYAHFGYSVDIDTNSVNLVVGAPNGDVIEPVTFDNGTTIWDAYSTRFNQPIFNSGVVYTYNYLPAANGSINNPGNFVFGQQIYPTNLVTGDLFGASVNYTSNRLLTGAPGTDIGVSQGNYGAAYVFDNPENRPAWAVIHTQEPAVDVSLITGVYAYDKLLSKVTSYFDFINPLQGKILGAARRNIDYIGAVDPAQYNQGVIHNNGNSWANEHLGEIWWDTDTVRFIDPNQDDIVYASRRWSQLFPGSRVDIYQWTASTVPPVSYTGTGTPLSTSTYTVNTAVNQQGIVETTYYFWVRGINTINTGAGKTLSPVGIATYIESPKTSGIPYLAPLNSSTVAIYNAFDLISAQDTILHIGYDRQAEGGDNNIHQEFQFIADGIADSFLNPTLYRKLQDSFCGVDAAGANVPDTNLSPAERYGVQFRPRQSMFADRFKALQNYLTRANTILAQYPISETRSFNLLDSSEPIPTAGSGQWNQIVANLEELSYQNLDIVPIGYLYLVLSDSNQDGRWTIYVVADGTLPGSRVLNLVRIQNYDTKLYWNYINWYAPGYNSSKQSLVQVPNYSSLNTVSLIDVPVGGSAKVVANAQGKFEIYLRTATGWTRVGLEDGTIEFKAELWNYALGNFGFDSEIFDGQYFDQEPVIETRKIIQAINEELFIDELAIERNSSLILMFNFIYSEFTTPEWLVKTSLVDVNHKIRALLPYQMYMQDNQTFVLDYIQEVKPYHVQIREFNLIYSGQDIYGGSLTDFDVPAYWDTTLDIPQYVSPILLPYDHATTTVQNDVSDAASNTEIWLANPWNQWFAHYLLNVDSVSITNPGTGYVTPPVVTVTGDCTIPAVLTATINSAGQVVNITIVNPGAGYTVTPIITIDGSGNGITATAVPLMTNGLVRSIKTVIKYDRCEYTSTVTEWQPNVTYTDGQLVRYADTVWSAIGTVNTSVFITANWTLADAGSLSGADRTMGYYLPTANEPGLELPLLIDGISYPGVQVTGPLYSQNTGFDVGNFDINPFDNISLDANGLPTYDYGILDTFYASFYGTPATGPIPSGTAATDINVDGGAYIDTYSSHAPEELIPGAEFDTLDMRIYTTPGADWAGDGHGFPEEDHNYEFDPLNPTLPFALDQDVIATPVSIVVTNVTQTHDLVLGVDYTVNWVDQTITVISGANAGDILQLTTYGVGGGNQLFKQPYNGAYIGDSVVIPIQYALIQEIAVFVNSVVTTDFTYAIEDSVSTLISFNNTYTATDAVVIVAIGPTTVGSTTVDYSWSSPQTQVITAVTGQLIYTLTNSLEYSNPDNMVVTVNGVRARTSAGAEYYADGSTGYLLPQRLGFSQSVIANTDVHVYVNDIPQQLNVDFVVEPYDPLDPARGIEFITPPAVGERILVCVNTNAQCIVVNSNQIQFNAVGGLVPNDGDTIEVTTFNDTRQQNILTQVFVGPTTTGITVTEAYDETDFDIGTVTGDSGSYDYAAGVIVTVNNLVLEHTITDPTRIWVTLNGNRLTYGFGFNIVNNEIILNQILGPTDIVMVTEFTESLVPDSMAFRIFQDMRGVQAIYRITPSTTTALAQPLLASDDVVYVTNASALGEPDVAINIWGVIMINGERIMYRERDTVNNTVSSLLRGTAGTAATDHVADSVVTDMGRGNLLPEQYQNYIVSNIDPDTRQYPLGDGSTLTFTADAIDLGTAEDSTNLELAVEVYVGGTLVTPDNYTINTEDPVSITFDTAPASGSAVAILVRRGVDWYNPGVNTPSDGVALQNTNNMIARFLRGGN